MPTKSIIDIEIDTTAFEKFKASYAAYEQSLGKTPEAWEKVTKEAGRTAEEFMALVTAATAGVALATELADAEKATAKELDQQKHAVTGQARSWHDMAKDSKSFAASIANATISLLRWSTITGAISGVIGAGGLFGIERLATSAAASRHLAGGTGTTIGERSAFETNFGRLVDNPNGLLTGVFESLNDVTKSAPYAALNLNYQTEQKKGPFDASIDVLRGLKDLADKTPEAQLGTTFQARGLGQFGSIEDFHRLKERSRSEIEDDIRHAQTDRRSLNISDPKAKAWEDLQVQLKRAGESIEKTLIVGLTNLAAPIGHLSDSVVHGIEAFASSDRLKVFIDEVATSLDGFATKIGTPEFDKSVTGFADGIGTLAVSLRDDLPGITTVFNTLAAMGNVLGAVAGPLINGRPPDPNNPLPNDPPLPGKAPDLGGAPSFKLPSVPGPDMGGAMPGFVPMAFHFGDPSAPRGIRNNNPLNLTYVSGQPGAMGSDGRFGVYGKMEDGIAQAERQLLLYQDRDHLDTIGQIINKWAPSSENNTANYIASVSKWMHMSATEKLNLRDPETARKLITAMGRIETGRTLDPSAVKRGVDKALGNPATNGGYQQQFKDRSVQVTITNNTGGNVNVAATQLVGT
jgi:hypothetical protein